MTEAKHTPGPWNVNVAVCNINGCDILAGDCLPSGGYRGPVCHIQSCDHIGGISIAEAKANARLIAAAPELLDALKIAVGHIEHMAAFITSYNQNRENRDPAYSFESLGEDMPGIHAAIAKAAIDESGHCIHCGRDNRGYETEPCSDDCLGEIDRAAKAGAA